MNEQGYGLDRKGTWKRGIIRVCRFSKIYATFAHAFRAVCLSLFTHTFICHKHIMCFVSVSWTNICRWEN